MNIFLNPNALFLDIAVLGVMRHGCGVALYVSDKLEFQVTMCGSRELEFLCISVHNVNNAQQRLHIGLWYRPPANSVTLGDLQSVLESQDTSILSNFALLGDFNIYFITHRIHFVVSYPAFYTVLTQLPWKINACRPCVIICSLKVTYLLCHPTIV